MRTLLLFRGAPGCGKSTFIEANGLKNYAISADEIRFLCASPEMNLEGEAEISQANDKVVWQMLYKIFEIRMKAGEFTVVDATNSKTVEMNRYKDLAKLYRYRIYIIDMTGLPIEECKRRNAGREALKRVPDEVIDRMYSRFATQKIPAGIVVLSMDEKDDNYWKDAITFKPIDLNSYKRVHVIGDIHGCNTALQKYLEGGINSSDYYIFCGDYIDRGIENADVLKFMFSIMNNDNVCLLEGNHERWLFEWANDRVTSSKEFERHTKAQLFTSNVDKRLARMFYRKLRQCCYAEFDGINLLVTHAGLSKLPDNFVTVATEQMIKGVGGYRDTEKVATAWGANTKTNCWQVFGHRGAMDGKLYLNNRCICLENQVEFGGNLCAVVFEHGFEPMTIKVKNDVFRTCDTPNENTQDVKQHMEVEDLVTSLRKNHYVFEKEYGHISAFNFTRDAFFEKHWDGISNKARGLFIDTERNEIVARSYDKFFQVNERPETKIEKLNMTLQFPVSAYRKENGFLGMVSYNSYEDSLFISSKSSPDGPYSDYFKEILYNTLNEAQLDKMKALVRDNKCTFVFEVIDPVNDPHIIEYKEPHIVLLDCVYNDTDFRKEAYDTLKYTAFILNLPIKEKAAEFADWAEFYQWYEEVQADDYQYNNEYVEGFVLEDANNFMFKLKLTYYKQWKFLRGVLQSVKKRGAIKNTAALVSPLENYFYGYLRELREANPDDFKQSKAGIIEYKNMFYAAMAERGVKL